MSNNQIESILPVAAPNDVQIMMQNLAEEADLKFLLQDASTAAWVLFLTRDYLELFEDAARVARRLSEAHNVCYLFDFDVLRNHLTVRSPEHPDTFLVDFLFYRSTVKFALPAGAFSELLEYLARFERGGRRLKPSCELMKSNADHQQAIAEIAQVLCVDDADLDSPADVAAAICGHLEDRMIELTRLLSLLTSPRFLGVVSEVTHEEYEAWFDLISSVDRPRRRGLPRDLVDQRDAINIAIAFSSWFPVAGAGRPDLATSEPYVLVSQTHAVLYLLRQFGETGKCVTLADLYDREAYTLREEYPVLHPRIAAAVELLGGVDDPKGAVRRARLFRDNFRKVSDFFEDRLDRSKGGEVPELYERALGEFIDEEQEVVQDLLGQMARQMSAKDDDLRRIEEARSTAASVESAHRRETRERIRYTDLLLQRSTGFLHMLDEVTAALEVTPGADYQARATAPDHRPFKIVEILRSSASKGAEQLAPVISGEIYETKHGGHKENAYYALRWPIFCGEDNFIDALKVSLNLQKGHLPKTQNAARSTSQLQPIETHHRFWTEGVIVGTSIGDFGLSLAEACGGGEWTPLRLPHLGALLKRLRKLPILPGGKKLIPEIQQLRLNTRFGDFVYDVTPADGENVRLLTILSHYDLSIQVVSLYKHTAPEFCCFPDRLLKALKSVLSAFPGALNV